MSKHRLEVSINIPGHTELDNEELAQYAIEALDTWYGQEHPDSPRWDLKNAVIKVAFKQDYKKMVVTNE